MVPAICGTNDGMKKDIMSNQWLIIEPQVVENYYSVCM